MSSKFETINGMKFRRKVRAIVVNEIGEVLLIQPHSYSENQWTYVGGGVEEGESPEKAIRREILEEVGIKTILRIKKSNYAHRFLFSESAKLKRGLDYDGQSAEIFWVQVPSESIVKIQSEEVKSYLWVKESDLRQYVTIAAQYEVFERLYAELGISMQRAA